MIDTLSTVGACPARLTATVVGSRCIETRPSILTGVVQTFIVFLKIKKMEGKPVKYFIPDVRVGNSQEISAGYTKICQPCSNFSRSNH